jgi:hypothetical protein
VWITRSDDPFRSFGAAIDCVSDNVGPIDDDALMRSRYTPGVPCREFSKVFRGLDDPLTDAFSRNRVCLSDERDDAEIVASRVLRPDHQPHLASLVVPLAALIIWRISATTW